MDKEKKDMIIVKHIQEYCAEIEQTVSRFGDAYEIFETDKIYRNAAIMCILQIGELAGRLSHEFISVHNEIPWRNIRGMRNIVAHAYGSVSIPDVWDTIVEDIPILRAYCCKLLGT